MSDDDPTNPHMPVAGDDRCSTCGFVVPAGARFCPNCGAARSPADAADAADADTDSTRVMAPIAGAGPPVVEEEVVRRPMAARDRPWPWALTLGVPAAILLVLLIVLAARSLGGDDSPGDTTTTSSATSTTVTTTRSVTSRPAVTSPRETRPPETSPPETQPPPTSPPATQPPDTITVP
jgi:hypothetical protein